MAGPSGASAESSSHTPSEETCPSDSPSLACPFGLAQIRVMICHCGNPLECTYTSLQLHCQPAQESTAPDITPRRSTEPSDSLDGSTAATPASDVLPSTGCFDGAAREGSQAVWSPVGGSRSLWWSTRRSATSEKSWMSTRDDDAASCSQSIVRAPSSEQCISPVVNAPLQKHGPPQHQSKTFVDVLCCSRWKHSFRSTSHASGRSVVGDLEAGKTSDGSGAVKLSASNATSSERGVVCGMLLYEGQSFFEGRLLYKQLNGSLCWNDAAWKRLYYTLTLDEPPNVKAELAADAVCHRTTTETNPMTASPSRQVPEGRWSSNSPDRRGDRTFLVLHAVDQSKPTENACSMPFRDVSTAVASELSPSTRTPGPSSTSGHRSARRLRRSQAPSVPFNAFGTSQWKVSEGEKECHCVSSSCQDDTSNPIDHRGSHAGGQTPASVCSRRCSGPVRDDYSQRFTDNLSPACASAAYGRWPADAYTLSVVMQVGAASCAIYVPMTEPIRLQPLTLAGGVAKLTAAALLMHRLHTREQRMLQEQYIACLDALHSITKDMATVAAHQQKREDTLLEGACKLLNEKKRKLQALQQRVTFLEKKLVSAGRPGDSSQAEPCGTSQPRLRTASVSTVGDHVATTHTSETRVSGSRPPAAATRTRRNGETAPSKSSQSGDNANGGLELARSERRTTKLSKCVSRKRALGSCGVRAERPLALENDSAECNLRDKYPSGLLLVQNKELFPKAFACIHVKEETLQA